MIRKATLQDFQAIALIQFNSDYSWNTYTFEEELHYAKLLLKNETVYLLEENNFAIGYISIDADNNIGMAVHKDFHRKGYGKQLLKHLTVRPLFAQVWANNPALSLYITNGFKIIKEEQNIYPDGSNLLYLELS